MKCYLTTYYRTPTGETRSNEWAYTNGIIVSFDSIKAAEAQGARLLDMYDSITGYSVEVEE